MFLSMGMEIAIESNISVLCEVVAGKFLEYASQNLCH